MQHNCHEMLFQRLAAVTDRVKLALKEADPDVLRPLAEENENIMKELQEAGPCGDRNLLDRVQALCRQVLDVIMEIQHCQHEVSTQIKQVADGKKMIHAYVK